MGTLLLAYIDPNSGGLLFQMLAAAFVFLSSLVFFFSSQIKMLAARVRRLFRERGTEGSPPTGEKQAE
ncbi:MAG: hypothetical protein KJ063_08600 [Anaerolineae bacterium]|nr:hypothetical protein [Anaerolineae bacterium]